MLKSYSIWGQKYSHTQIKKLISSMDWDSVKSRYPVIMKYVKGKRILDYGCGWGNFTKTVANRFPDSKFLGIDPDKETIKVAKNVVGETANLKFRNIKASVLENESFDCVMSNQVIEHTHNPGDYLSECNRVLIKGGRLVINFPNEINILFLISQLVINKKRALQRFEKTHDFTNYHVMTWSFYNFCRLANSLGFKYVDHTFMEGMPVLGGYVYLNVPFIRNLSNTMLIVLEKDKYIKPQSSL